MSTKMKVKEFEASLHLPQKLEQIIKNGKEIPQMLPPRSSRRAYPVDSYPACPDTWMNGSDIAGSYFIGVEEDKGMWLDFNPCCSLDRDVAIVVSIQGVNPITGQKTDALRLEQYKKKCPIHDIDFQQDNYCPKCDFDWPDQNYLATTGTPMGNLWLDGFRRPDGTVRQYIFTAEEMKGIASQIIGKDKVYAIGIAFYYSKEEKPKQIGITRSWDNSSHSGTPMNQHWFAPLNSNMYCSSKDMTIGGCMDMTIGGCMDMAVGGCMDDLSLEMGNTNMDGLEGACASMGASASASVEPRSVTVGIVTPEAAIEKGILQSKKPMQVTNSLAKKVVKTVKPTKKLEIGAGALISQKVYRDTREIEYWEEEPASMLYINYCDMDTLNNILEAGEIKKKTEGFMDRLTVGS